MSRWGRHKHDDTEVALANFALTFAKALLVFCVILFVMITDDQKKSEGVKPKAEVIITVDWPKEAKTDIDTWFKLPSGEIIMYQNKEAGVVFLDRDDLGRACTSVCEEILTLRGMPSGEYVLNLNVYSGQGKSDGQPLNDPVTVHVKITRLNPNVMILWEADVVLVRSKEEKHVVRFRIDNETIGNFTTSRPTKLMKQAGN